LAGRTGLVDAASRAGVRATAWLKRRLSHVGPRNHGAYPAGDVRYCQIVVTAGHVHPVRLRSEWVPRKPDPHAVSPASRPSDDERFALQQTLYASQNATRRWLHQTRYEWIVASLSRLTGAKDRVLEIGPGSGIYIPTLISLAGEVFASDIESVYLDRLRPLADTHAALHLVHDDITRSEFPSDFFDLILCTEVIEHISSSPAALAEMGRILRPNGLLLLSTPQRYSSLEVFSKIAFLPGFIQLARLVYREPILDTEHINLLTRRELHSQLTKAGFNILETDLTGLYVPGFAELMGTLALRIERSLEARLRHSILEWVLWTQYVVARSNAG
jgi:2-polyprenyl-3-methyl-5-hydroxy-6-metoxy-1,4-benzoquinol methylase